MNYSAFSKVLCKLFAGMVIVGSFAYGSVSVADVLQDINTNKDDLYGEERVFDFKTYSPESDYYAEDYSGITKPYKMTVDGIINSDGIKSTLDYSRIYYGFKVNESTTTLIINNVTVQNAYYRRVFDSDYLSSFIHNAGVLKLTNISLKDNIYDFNSFEGENYAGAIYTTSDIELIADKYKSVIQGNNIIDNNSNKFAQAIYVDNADAKLTLSAVNGGTWDIYDYINGANGYKVYITGDTNSTIILKNAIKNANVTVSDNVNLYIAPETFQSSNVKISNANISLVDGSISDYVFNKYESTVSDRSTFEFEVTASGADKISVTNSGLLSAVTLNNLVFNGLNDGNLNNFKNKYTLVSPSSENVYLKLGSNYIDIGSDTWQGSFTNISNEISYDSIVKKYTYNLQLDKSSPIRSNYDSITITDFYAGEQQDALEALNTYRTMQNRKFIVYDEDSYGIKSAVNHQVSANTGKNANLSSLDIIGYKDSVSGNYSSISYQGNYSGFELGVGSRVKVSDIEFRNAQKSANGALFNIGTNAVLNYENGNISSNTSTGNGGAVYIEGNSFLTLNNVNFSGNQAVSGGGLYIFSDSLTSPLVTGVIGQFTENKASQYGGALANVTQGSGNVFSLINDINGSFIANNVLATGTDDGFGGGIYNSAKSLIQNINGNFSGNYVISDNNAYGGAIYNAGNITKISGSFTDNYVKSGEGCNALGGAIYTTSNLTFDVKSYTEFSGNYVQIGDNKNPNDIYVYTESGNNNVNLNFNISNGSTLNIKDGIEGDGIYNLNFVSESGDLNKINLTGNIINGNVSFVSATGNLEIITDENVFADTNSSLTLNKVILNTQNTNDNNEKVFDTYNISKLTSLSDTKFKIDFGVQKDGEDYSLIADKYTVGNGSSGAIIIENIGDTSDLINIAEALIDKESENISFQVLNRINSSDAIYLELSNDVKIQEEKTINKIGDVYTLNSKDFIGKIGLDLNETRDSLILGVLERKDNLNEINEIVDELTPTNTKKVLNFNSDYKAKTDLGTTSAGSFTLKGDENTDIRYILDMDKKSGFNLTDNVNLKINKLTVKNARPFIRLNANNADEANPNIVIDNVIFTDNSQIIDNTKGVISMKDVSISVAGVSDIEQNTIKNGENGIILISGTSNLYSQIQNDGVIKFIKQADNLTNITIGSDDSHIVQIAGNGKIVSEADFVDLRNASFNPIEGNYNTFELNSGTLIISKNTLNTAGLKGNGGTVDLSTYDNQSFQSYTIGKYTEGTDGTTTFITDADFSSSDNNSFDTITIHDSSSSGVIKINLTDKSWETIEKVNENIDDTWHKSSELSLYKDFDILYAPNDVTLEVVNGDKTINFYLKESDEKVVLEDNTFLGTISVRTYNSNDRSAIRLIRTMLPGGIGEINQLPDSRYQFDNPDDKTKTYINLDKPREFILSDIRATDRYQNMLNIGETRKGEVILRAVETITGEDTYAIIDMKSDKYNPAGGFEVTTKDSVKLTTKGVEIKNAGTKGVYDIDGKNTRSQENGSVMYLASENQNTKATVLDSKFDLNSSEGLGGAIYSENNLDIIAKDKNVLFTSNYQDKNDANISGTLNDIYMAGNSPTLSLIAYKNKTISILSGLDVALGTKLNLIINDSDIEAGNINLVLRNDIGNATNHIKNVELNGGTLNLHNPDQVDNLYTTIYTSGLVVNKDTYLDFDINFRTGEYDKIWTDRVRQNTGINQGKILITKEVLLENNPDNQAFLDEMTDRNLKDYRSKKLRVLELRTHTANFLGFENPDEDTYAEKPVVDSILLFTKTLDSTTTINYYAKLGLNGSIIVGWNPDCSGEPLVQLLSELKNKTYKINNKDNTLNTVTLFNYGTDEQDNPIQSGIFWSKKLTVKGDGASLLRTPNEINGFKFEDTTDAKGKPVLAQKKQFVGNKFTMQGFDHAFINGTDTSVGGKIKLSYVNFLENETEGNGSVVENLSGTFTLTANKKNMAQVHKNLASNLGGVIYNKAGTVTLKWVQFGKATDKLSNYGNSAYVGGVLTTFGKATVSNSNFAYNDSDFMGGAVYTASNTKYTSNTFESNKSTLGGAIYVNAEPDKKLKVNITKNKFYSNSANTSTLSFTEYDKGELSGAYDGMDSDEKTTLQAEHKTQDVEQSRGGAIFIEKGNVTISKSNFGATTIDKNQGNRALMGAAIYNDAQTVDETIKQYNITTVSSSKFSQNGDDNTKMDEATTLGGAIYNKGVMNLKSNTFGILATNKNPYNYGNYALTGGAVYNDGTLTDKSSKYYYNQAKENGGAIYNSENGVIQTTKAKNGVVTAVTGGLNSVKISYNSAENGGGIYNEGLIGISKATFTGNAALYGAGLYNKSYDKDEVIKNTIISSSFFSNKATNKTETDEEGAETVTESKGGAIYNEGDLTVSKSTFGKKSTKTTDFYNKATNGGAVYNTSGDWEYSEETPNKYPVYRDTSSKYQYNQATNGGAFYNDSKSLATFTGSTFNSNNAEIGGAVYLAKDSVTSFDNVNFKNNIATNLGGAVYVGENAFVQIKDSNFTKNTSTNYGGALYIDKGATVNIYAVKKNVTFSNNTSANGGIFMNGSEDKENTILNLSADKKRKITINDYIDGSGIINQYGEGTIVLNAGTSSDITVNPKDAGTLQFEDEKALSNRRINVTISNSGTTFNTTNNSVGTMSLGRLSLGNNTTTNLAIDVNLKSATSDKIQAETVEGTGVLNVSEVNLTSDSKTPVTVKIGKDSLVTEMTATKAETAQATYRLKAGVDENGYLTARAYGQKAKPAVVAAPVAAQLGGYLTQVNSYDQAFMNMDMNMLKTREERKAEEMANRYAYADNNYTFTPDNGINKNSKGLWVRPYATFERVNLHNGPKVGNIAYGSFFGGDAEIKHLKNGWKRQFSAYIGYNGSTQDFDRQSIDQNGGTLGVMETWYKGNFFTALTANVSGNFADASTDIGKERMAMIMAGVASKTGYNFEFKQGKFIIQPSLLLSYSFVHTFAHNNGLGNRVSSSPLNAIQVAPGIKFIANLKNGWQPYLGVNMRWNIIDKTHFNITDVNIPDMSIRPYVEYGVGLQKRWGERFTGYGQAMIRNGGRNGVMLSIGFRWALGK